MSVLLARWFRIPSNLDNDAVELEAWFRDTLTGIDDELDGELRTKPHVVNSTVVDGANVSYPAAINIARAELGDDASDDAVIGHAAALLAHGRFLLVEVHTKEPTS